MLSEVDKTYVTEKLCDVLSQGDPRALLAAVLPPACMSKIRILPLPLAYAMDAVAVCLADRWNNEPCWLFLLMALLPKEPQTVAIRARIEQPIVSADPTEATVLITEVPFIDRERLRKTAKALATRRPARPIFVVTGDPKSGKTFTGEFVQHLYLSDEDIEFCFVKFPSGDGPTFGPVQAARRILEDAAVDLKRLPPTFFENTTNNTRWPYDLAGQVLNECSSSVTKQHWIVLDGFTGPELREDTRKFVDGLAERITESSIFHRIFRLLLLGFDRSLLTVQPHVVEVEQIRAPGDTHVAQCVAEIFQRFQQPALDVGPLVTRIMDGLPGGDQQMIELQQRLRDLLEEVREAANA